MEVESRLPSSTVWRLPPKEPLLPEGVVHVYRIALDLPEQDIRSLTDFLSPDELARAERYVFPSYRAHYIAGRGQLRTILARYEKTDPDQLKFCYNEYGKPALDPGTGGGWLRFNISHSHELGLVAVTHGKEVGVDIERVRADIDYAQIAHQFFSATEVDKLMTLPDNLRQEAFYTCWTRKEAFIKARGQGLTIPLDQFDVTMAPNEPARLTRIGSELVDELDWSLHELRPGTGYVAALAVQGQDWELTCWQWPLRKL